MSLQPGTTPTTRPFRTLLDVCQAAGRSDRERTSEELKLLPKDMRERIFCHVYDLAGRPQNVESNWGEIHVFDSLPRLQSAIKDIAFDSFFALSGFFKNLAALRAYRNAGSPQTQEDFFYWGETKATAEVLLQSFDDIQTYLIRTNLTPAEIKEILDAWVRECNYPERRSEARDRIMDFVNGSHGVLSLANLGLTSLPPIFHADVFTTRLKELACYQNQLQSLPEQISQLQMLECLDIRNNHFQTLPSQVCKLQSLKDLKVSCNNLHTLPPEIFKLQSLKNLSVSNNNLHTLPPEISQLTALESLHIAFNSLQSLPEQIGQLRMLKMLYLADNLTLTGLPMQILDLPSSCEIDLSSTGLSRAVLTRLREATSSPDYHGPRILFSMENFEARTQERLIEELLQELFSLSGQPVRTFDSLMSADRTSLHSWLSRLSYTADYRKEGEKQKAFARKVLGYMQLAEENPKYREEFFLILADASQTCGDRVTLSILKLGMAHRMMTLDNFEALTSFLVQTVWPVQMLEEIARNKVPALPFVDEVEVYLAYPVKLREVLGLEIDVEQMLYFTCSSLKQQDLDEAAEFVKRKQADRDAVLGFLIENARWMEMFKKAHADEVEKIEEEAAKEIENAAQTGASNEQYKAIQARRDEKLKALVQKSLKD